jgi:hypothetical protein
MPAPLPAASSSRLRPLAPRTRVRVGVSGHRGAPKLPAEAVPAVRARVDEVIAIVAATAAKVAQGLDDKTAECVVVSALADGSDRIVAHAGLAARFTLEAVLPFVQAQYAEDFDSTPGSRDEFLALIATSSTVCQLASDPKDRPRGYEAAGIVMLTNCDVLITIWDGEREEGIGGTAQIVDRAVNSSIPTIWIKPTSPEQLYLSWPEPGALPLANVRPLDSFRPAKAEDIAQALEEILRPPQVARERAALDDFLAEREQRWNFCMWYPLLVRLVAGRKLRPMSWADLRPRRALADSQAFWAPYFAKVPADATQRPAIERALLPAYAAADHLANFYAQAYRSAYVFNFTFAAVAVMLALLGVFIHEPFIDEQSLRLAIKPAVVTIEIVVIVSILATWRHGHLRQWHRRWLDYRRLAECLRQMRILAPTGSSGPIDRPRRALSENEEDWVGWYAWSLWRRLPLPNCIIDVPYAVALCDAVRSTEIADQIRYHERNAERMKQMDERMHRWGRRLFLTTLVVGFLFVLVIFPTPVRSWFVDHTFGEALLLSLMTFVTALLPTVGAALAAVHVQGDFATVAAQSKRTADRLRRLDDVLAAEHPAYARLSDRIEKVSDVMIADLDEWQTVFRTRPLSLPA